MAASRKTANPPKRGAPLNTSQGLLLPLSSLKGLGPKRVESFARKGLHTVLDLLFFIPRRYEDRRIITPIGSIQDGLLMQIAGNVVFGGEEIFFPSRKKLFRIRLEDGTGALDLIWFQYQRSPMTRLAAPGTRLLVYGKVTGNRGGKQIIHPDIAPVESHSAASGLKGPGIVPLYSQVKGISSRLVRTFVGKALSDYSGDLIDPLPRKMIQDLELPALSDALHFLHRPSPQCSIEELNVFHTPYHRRLLFDRFFTVMMTLAFLKKSRERKIAPACLIPPGLLRDLEQAFPFLLTAPQVKAVREVALDLSRPIPMNRLLLGDVGCGKTVVAAMAACIAAHNGKQTAIMAPTQILAEQHMEFFSALASKMGFRPVLLTGTLRAPERRTLHAAIRTGTANLIIGTQALIQGQLTYADLGLVIIDEQHRFGVRERAAILQKGHHPHHLVMTATPIPRTLATALYGDMDISMIDAYPQGHRPVTTRLVAESGKREVFEAVKAAIDGGRQVFVICPVIEGVEEGEQKSVLDMAEKLTRLFSPTYRIGLIHGRMDREDLEKTMGAFRKGLIHLLVGTTVLEVGIHVPKATVIVIEHPERFGLAQLHQLRGRVGRGSDEGACFLMVSEALSEKVLSRLKILEESSDGFFIAQKDMELRGQGELAGMQQAGMGELDLEEVLAHQDLLFQARDAARRLLEDNPELEGPEHIVLKTYMEAIMERALDR